ncbi:MAG: hypothetical protein OEY51_14590 [Cyclobacteriaceae bacterium]|nr:hypothetical protein [Cyclobacteriaceae bacterium]
MKDINGWFLIALLILSGNMAIGGVLSRNGDYFATVYFENDTKKSILSVINTYTGELINDFEGIDFNSNPRFYMDQGKGREFLLALSSDMYFYSVDFSKKWTYRLSEFKLDELLPGVIPLEISMDEAGSHFIVGVNSRGETDKALQDEVYVIHRLTRKVIMTHVNARIDTDGKRIIVKKGSQFFLTDPVTGEVEEESMVLPLNEGDWYLSPGMHFMARFFSNSMGDPGISPEDYKRYKEGYFKVYNGISGNLVSTIGARKMMGNTFVTFCPDGSKIVFGSSEIWLYDRATEKLDRVRKASNEKLFKLGVPCFSQDGKVMLISEGPAHFLLFEFVGGEVKEIGDYEIGI